MENPLDVHSLVLTNQISIMAIPVFVIISLILGLRQWNAEPLFVLLASVFFIAAPILNAYGFSQFSRLLLCFALPFIIMGMSIISKTIPNEEITNSEFFDYRYVLIATSILPPIVFNFQRSILLYIGALPFFISLIFFDEFHDFFGVGFYQISHDIDSYQTTTWISSLMFIVVATVLFMLRRSSDYLQIRNSELIRDLKEARNRIMEQNLELNEKNHLLVDKVSKANEELVKSNSELIKHNNELQQFSYTVSHNLRGPVARILGLTELFNVSSESEKEEYLHLMKRTAKLLDTNIKDLGTIVDIRKDVFRIRQEIFLDNLIEELQINYKNELESRNVLLETSFEAKSLTTIRPMIVSIFDNLFSNALKYSSRERRPEIRITSKHQDNHTIIKVRDNGIGIDLAKHGGDLFRLYKRFNTQTEGKGVGLYLVLKQVESLGGQINVDSEVNSFTEFKMTIPDIKNVDHQEIYKKEYVHVYFDAGRDLLTIDWLSSADSDGFRDCMNRAYESLKELKVKSWLIDISKREAISEADRHWFLNIYVPEVFKQGLKNLAVVSREKPLGDYTLAYSENIKVLKKYGIEVYFGNSLSEANQWLHERQNAYGLPKLESN